MPTRSERDPRAIDRRRALSLAARGALGLAAARVLATPTRSGSSGDAIVDVTSARRIATVPAPTIITRAQWGADESARRGEPSFHPIRKFVIHHTATPGSNGDPARRVRSIYESHLRRRDDDGTPWEDLGYNFVVDEAGRIYEGRHARRYAGGEVHDGEDRFARGVRGAHAGEANGGSVGIAIIGSYLSARPTDASINAVVDLIAWKCDRHALDPLASEPYTGSDGLTVTIPTIVGHRDVRSTACPGDGIYGLLSTIRQRVAARVPAPDGTGPGGYRILHADGTITLRGEARDVGDLRRRGVATSAVGLAAVDPHRFWVADGEGGVHSFGLPYRGSIPGLRASGVSVGQTDVVDIAATPAGDGYWILDRAGGIFAFNAPFHGSIPSLRASGVSVGEADAVALEPTTTGDGYWVLDRAGGVFAFGHAPFHGSVPALLASGVDVGLSDAVDLRRAAGGGYWIVDAAGGVFAFGGAPFFGSTPGSGFPGADAARLIPTPTGRGYVLALSDGAVLPFGDAAFHRHGPHVTTVDLQISS